MKTNAERQSSDLETGEVKWRVRLLYLADGNPQDSLHMYDLHIRKLIISYIIFMTLTSSILYNVVLLLWLIVKLSLAGFGYQHD